jgi:deoxyribonuclease (pyrimidine dimer)
MTRINLVDPTELADQHLFAEWREIKMVPAALKRSLRTKTTQQVLKSIPKDFTLNKGHVLFFYDKMQYLSERYSLLSEELRLRGYRKELEWNNFADYCEGIPQEFFTDYTPTSSALVIIRDRIRERIGLRPNWYKYYSMAIYNIQG